MLFSLSVFVTCGPSESLLSLSAAKSLVFLLVSCHTVQHSVPGGSQCLLSELMQEHVTCAAPSCTLLASRSLGDTTQCLPQLCPATGKGVSPLSLITATETFPQSLTARASHLPAGQSCHFLSKQEPLQSFPWALQKLCFGPRMGHGRWGCAFTLLWGAGQEPGLQAGIVQALC